MCNHSLESIFWFDYTTAFLRGSGVGVYLASSWTQFRAVPLMHTEIPQRTVDILQSTLNLAVHTWEFYFRSTLNFSGARLRDPFPIRLNFVNTFETCLKQFRHRPPVWEDTFFPLIQAPVRQTAFSWYFMTLGRQSSCIFSMKSSDGHDIISLTSIKI